MKLEGGVAKGSNAAAVKTDNLFTGGNEISPADPHPAQGDGWRRAVLCARVRARDGAPANLVSTSRTEIKSGNTEHLISASTSALDGGRWRGTTSAFDRATRLEMCASVHAPRVFVG